MRPKPLRGKILEEENFRGYDLADLFFATDVASAAKWLEQRKECRSDVAFHICKKHPEDCEFYVKYKDVLKAFPDVSKGKK